MVKQIAFIFIVCTFGCASERQFHKAETKLAQAGRLAKICADRFPSRDSVRDSLITDTLLVGEYIFDTTTVNDTVYLTKIQVKTVYKTMYKIVYKERTDKIQAIQVKLDQCNNDFADLSLSMIDTKKELDRAKRDANLYFWWLWIVICLSILWTFRKFIAQYVVR